LQKGALAPKPVMPMKIPWAGIKNLQGRNWRDRARLLHQAGRGRMVQKHGWPSLATAERLVSTHRLCFFMSRFNVLGRKNDFAATYALLSRRVTSILARIT
jgi:hypothetical protein